jgi:hypothetical protein
MAFPEAATFGQRKRTGRKIRARAEAFGRMRVEWHELQMMVVAEGMMRTKYASIQLAASSWIILRRNTMDRQQPIFAKSNFKLHAAPLPSLFPHRYGMPSKDRARIA